MKQFALILFLFFCLFAQAGGEKKALVIAVGDYPTEGYWGKISSDKDVPLILNALHHHGFVDENILIIQDSVATKAGIISAIQKITRDAEKGDILVVHYSGHGQQMWDKDGDELDGKDESIVPYNAPMKFIKNEYEGENHLRDDELEILFGDLRAKLGSEGSLTVIFDACHSGTATRGGGMAPSRGTTEFMGPSDWPGKPGKDKGTMNMKPKTRGAGETDLAPMVLFSGASASQLNYETYDEDGNTVGSLSYTISKVLLNANKTSTYREIFDQVRIEMSVITPRQTPQVEGEIDKVIFGGKGSDKAPYFLNTQVIDGKTTVVNGGKLSGLFNKSKVALYPPNVEDIKKSAPLAQGVIANANLVNADVIWDTEIDKEILRKSFVYITAQNYETVRLKVKLNISDDPDLLSALQTNIKEYQQVIEVTTQAPQIVIEKTKTRGTSAVEVVTNTAMVIRTDEISENKTLMAANITKTLLQYAQARFLRDLNTSNPEVKLHMEMIPILEVEKQVTGEGRYKRTKTIEKSRGNIQDKMVNGTIVLDSGDMFKLKITNNGNDVAYFTLLDIMADNNVAVMIPRKNEPAAEYMIRPGETLELDRIYTVVPPQGMETFKLIASLDPIDLRKIVISRGGANPQSPFEKLIQSSYVEKTRGVTDDAEDIEVPADAADVFTLVFKIK